MAPQKKANGNGGKGKAKPPEESPAGLEVLNRGDAADCLPGNPPTTGTAYLGIVDGVKQWIPEGALLKQLSDKLAAGRPPT
jgi:hypothetical protein